MQRSVICALALGVVSSFGATTHLHAQGLTAAVDGSPTLHPNTAGTLAYQGPTDGAGVLTGDFFYLCNNGQPFGEIIEDVHLTAPGALASFDIGYFTRDVTGPITAYVTFYTNNATDTLAPTSVIASYTLTNLPTGFNIWTYDVPTPVAVPQDIWMGVRITFGATGLPNSGGSIFGAGVFGPNPGETIGTSHDIFYTGSGSCTTFGPNDIGNVDFALAVRTFPNTPPTCALDPITDQAGVLEVGPGDFVVTEGETITVSITATDLEGDVLSVSTSGLPTGATVSPSVGSAPLTTNFQWTPTAFDKAGAPYVVDVTFTDTGGLSDTCSLTISDINLKPTCSASDQTVQCTSSAGADVTLMGSATDPDDDDASLIYKWEVSNAAVILNDSNIANPTGTFPIGVTMATLVVCDGRGGVATCDVLITVEDTNPPEVMCTSDVAVLWPPNHKMHTVSLVVTATDECLDPSAVQPIVVTVRSDEPDDATGNGDGATTGDVDGADGFSAVPGGGVPVTTLLSYDSVAEAWTGSVQLRAERDGAADGRKYTIDVSATDASGNTAYTSCCILVPHDKRKGTTGP